jgi:hypothetical protein
MQIVRLLSVCVFVMATSVSHASDSFVLAQASTSENTTRSNSSSTDRKSDAVVISTPKPRERVVPQTTQPSPPVQMPIIVMPTVPQK